MDRRHTLMACDASDGRTQPLTRRQPSARKRSLLAAAPATATSSVIVTRTLRLKVRPEAYRWLKAAATEVNHVLEELV